MLTAPGRSKEFMEFCLSRPADERYNPLDINQCALGQFGVVGAGWDDCERQGIPRDIFETTIMEDPSTFGALADRLADRVEKQLAEQVPA